MLHQPIATPVTGPDRVRALLRRTQMALVLLVLAVVAGTMLRGAGGIESYYFFNQDMPLLIAAVVLLLLFARHAWATGGAPLVWRAGPVLGAIAAAAAVAYAGTWLVLARYAQSRDENLAEFAADAMLRGRIGTAIPEAVQPFANAAMPLSAGRWVASGQWVSDYLPVATGLRALAGLVGDPWLAGPVLLAIGLAAVWVSARRIWPERPEAAAVAALLGLTSTQLIVNAMSPFATTAHFALNAVWLACFLRGGRWGHGLALTVGLLATGLHQAQFHLLFLSGFVVWLWRSERRGLALVYAGAAVGDWAFWSIGYQHGLLPALFGPVAADPAAGVPLVEAIADKLERLLTLDPLNGISRFVAWQNVLLVPLAFVGAAGARRGADGALPISFALAVSCGIGLVLTPWQGFGFGYRYLHHLLPCFLLLAAAGAVRLRERGSAVSRGLLIASAVAAMLVTLPFAAWRSHALLAPYAAAHAMAARAPADFVVVDPLGGVFLQDIVRVEDAARRPLLLDLDALSPAQVRALCRRGSVMVMDARHARALGIIASHAAEGDFPALVARRRLLMQPGCARPVPLGV